MSTDTKAIIGTIVGTGLAVAGLLSMQISTQIAGVNARVDDLRGDLSAQIAGVNARVDDLRADVRDLRADMRADMRDIRDRLERFDARLDAVEVALGKLDQRLSTIERIVLPPAPSGE